MLIPTLFLLTASPDANAVISKIESTARSLHGFKCHLDTVRTYSGGKNPFKIEETLDVTYVKPNRFAITAKDTNEKEPSACLTDGQSMYYSSRLGYSKEPGLKNVEDFHWYHNDFLLLLVTGSFTKGMEFPVRPKASIQPDADWNGKSYHVLDLALGGGYPIDYKVYYDDDNIVRRILHTELDEHHPFIEDVSVVDFAANPSVDASVFHFTPSAGQKPFDESLYRRAEVPLISVGRLAAPFSLPTPAGPRLSLTDALGGKKAVLLNFWFVHCPPCRAEHPKLEKLYQEFRDKGFDVLSVDDQDSAADVAKYWKGAGLSFRTVLSGPMAAINPKTGYTDYAGPKLPDYASLVPYGIHECPTNILLNSDGQVVYVSTGWDENALRKALADLDVQ